MRRQNRGYTLVEVICVLAILAILATMAIPAINRYLDQASKQNCNAVMETLVEDIRVDSITKRFADADAVNQMIEHRLGRAANGAVSFEHTDTESGFRNRCVTAAICPNDGTYNMSWEASAVESAPYTLRLAFSCVCTCEESEDAHVSASFDVLVALKHPLTIEGDFYDALKSNTLALVQLAQEEAGAYLAQGASSHEAALQICGKISANARLYKCKGISGGTAVGPVSKIASQDGIGNLLQIDPSLGKADNHVLWGITINDAGEVEWLSYHCRFIDPDGAESTYFLVYVDGEIVTTKENYHNLRNASDQEANPPIEGRLGSAAAKAEWNQSVANQQNHVTRYVRTVGKALYNGSYNTHWIQRDSDWYVQSWGIYFGQTFGKNNVYSQRKLTHLTAEYVSSDTAGFQPAENLRVVAHYDDGTEQDVLVPTAQGDSARIDRYDWKNGAGQWYFTNGYVFTDDQSASVEWIGDLNALERTLANSQTLQADFAAMKTDTLTIAYQEYYKYQDDAGQFAYEPITRYCTIERSMTREDGSLRLRFADVSEESFALDQLPLLAEFSVRVSYQDANGQRRTNQQPGYVTEPIPHKTTKQFQSGMPGYYIRLHSESLPTQYVDDAALLRSLKLRAYTVDVVAYLPGTGQTVIAGQVSSTLSSVTAAYSPHSTQFFYLDRLQAAASYRIEVQDATQSQPLTLRRSLAHREGKTDGFLLTLAANTAQNNADLWASGTDYRTIQLLIATTGQVTLGVVYQDGGVTCRTDLSLTLQKTQVAFLWQDISSETDAADNAVAITEYFGDQTHVVFPYYVSGRWIEAGSLQSAVDQGYQEDNLICASKDGKTYYYIDDGTLHTVQRVGLLVPNDATDVNGGESQTGSNTTKRKQYAVKMPDGVTSIAFTEGIREIGVFAFQNTMGSQSASLTGAVVIPKSVTSIGRWAFNSSRISGLSFAPDSQLRNIYSSSFENCDQITSEIRIPEGTVKISQYAFQNCTGVTNLVIPSTVRSMGTSSFKNVGSGAGDLWVYGTSNGTAIGLDGNGQELTLFTSCRFRNVTIGATVKEIGYNTFRNGSLTGTLTILPGVTTIGSNAFSGCRQLIGDLRIPDTVTQIGNNSFENCSGMNGTLTLSDTLISIGQSAFSGCNLFGGDLTVPQTVTFMGNQCFQNFGSGTGSLTLLGGSNGNIIESGRFSGSRFENVTIGGSVERIGYAAFSGCNHHTGTLTLNQSVSVIESRGFYGCNNYSGDLTIPQTVSSIGWEAFSQFGAQHGEGALFVYGASSETTLQSGIFGGAKFTNVTIGGNVRVIGNGAFQNGTGITGELTLEDSITTIENSAFQNCRLVGDLYCSENLTLIGGNAFDGCFGFDGALVFLTKGAQGIQEIQSYAFRGCSGFTGDLTIPATTTLIGYQAFHNFGQGNGALSLFGGSNGATLESGRFSGARFTDVTIGGGVKIIANQAFLDCSNLRGSLTLQSSITEIGASAFQRCKGFTGDLVLPPSLETIAHAAFENCTGFDGALVFQTSGSGAAMRGVTTISGTAFQNCSHFTGDLIIPETVSSMEDAAFQNFGAGSGALYLYGGSDDTLIGSRRFTKAKFHNVVIGGRIQTIGNSAFENETGLTGTLTLSEGITLIGNKAFQNCSGFTGGLTIPASVDMIGQSAFQRCVGFHGTLSFATRSTPQPDGTQQLSGISTIQSSAFYGCDGFTGDLIIPSTVTTMETSCFSYFGQYGGKRTFGNANRMEIDLSQPSMGSLYCYAQVDEIRNDFFAWTHFDDIVLIDGAKSISGTSAFIGQTCQYFIILGDIRVSAQSVARGYRHPKTFFGDQVTIFSGESNSPFYQNNYASDAICPEGHYNGDAYLPPSMQSLPLKSGNGEFTYLTAIYRHEALMTLDPTFYRVVCEAVGVSLPEDFDPNAGYDPLAEALGCNCAAHE